MALAAAKTWNPGDVLTAADLNTLNTNILNNPISLISPTTGAINFQTSIAHTNLTPSAITASSAAATGNVLTALGTTTPIWSAPFFTNISVLSSTQTYAISTGVTRILVELWGGGGGGGGSTAGAAASGGGAGGYSLGLYTVTSSQTYSVTIGAGGAGAAAGGNAGTAGSSSRFGTLTSAGGGAGGSSGTSYVAGGDGLGGDLNIFGGIGFAGTTGAGLLVGGPGGMAARGGVGGLPNSGAGTVPGGGGAGGGNGTSGGGGAAGLCIVRW